MIGQLCRQAGIPRERIYEVAFAGNTTMQQLLCGVDTSPLGEVPFVPAGGRGLTCPPRSLGLHIHPRGSAYVMPVIGGFVGGDTVAGILATGLADADEPTLLVDIGTNGEIVLLAGGKLSAASTAAGPAFEGARISCGMRGSTGAIEKVVVDGRLRTNVIGNVPPAGLCGSGLIDVAAELLRHGLLTPQGRLQTPDQLPADVLARSGPAGRLARRAGVVPAGLGGRDRPTAGRSCSPSATSASCNWPPARSARASSSSCGGPDSSRRTCERVLIGGGFGNFIRRSNAQRIGLLPCRDRAPADPLHGQHVVGRRPAGGPLAAGPANWPKSSPAAPSTSISRPTRSFSGRSPRR